MKTASTVDFYHDLTQEVARAWRVFAHADTHRPGGPALPHAYGGTWADMLNLADPLAREERASRRLLKKSKQGQR